MGPFNAVDLAVIAIVLISALLAFARGFLREVLSVGAWVGAAFVTVWAFAPASALAERYIESTIIAQIAAGLGVFVVALLIFSVVSHALASWVQDSVLSSVDRSLGFVFGMLRGAVIVSLAYLFATWLWPDRQPAWLEMARTRQLLATGADVLLGLVPAETLRRAEESAETARRRGTETIQDARRAQRTLDAIEAAQQPERQDAGGPPRGYSSQERGRLEQLIETTEEADRAQPRPPQLIRHKRHDGPC